MANFQGHVVIVDGYSSGNLLAPAFNARGLKSIHVLSSADNEKIMLPSFNADDFSNFFTYDGDLENLTKTLQTFSPVCILPGTETGVELADALSERLRLITNGTNASEARRDKYEMAHRVRESGLPIAKQLKTDQAEVVIKWAEEHQLSKVVIKPLNSAGTDGFRVCGGPGAIATAVAKLIGKKNKLGFINTEILAQEFLAGTEYFVNTVSARGAHRVVEIWRYQKRSINGHDSVYDASSLCAVDDPSSIQLAAYVGGVLDALEIANGPAHTEVMMTAQGPRLVEVGARLDGLCVPGLSIACLNQSQVDLTVQAYLEPDSFQKMPYKVLKHSTNVHLASYAAGEAKGFHHLDKIRDLPSFFQMKMRAQVGAPVHKTVDWFTMIGFVSLAHADRNQVEVDFEIIRDFEKRGLVAF